jgi:hypothetical protein
MAPEGSQREEEDLNNGDELWLEEVANRSRNRFGEHRLLQGAAPVAPEEDELPPPAMGGSEIEVATNRYRVTVHGGMEHRLMDQILRLVPQHARDVRQPGCTGFCRHLQLNSNASNKERQLLFTMIMAALGS